MTLRPPQPPQSARELDAEERALAKSLPRLHGRTAPGPDLDASILAAAQAAVRTAKPSKFAAAPRIRWIAPASLAASMVLAVGMAWQLRPLPTLESAQTAAQSDNAEMATVQVIEPAPYDKPVPMVQSIPPAPVPAQSAAAERQRAAPPIDSSKKRSPAPEVRALETPVPLPPPPPPQQPASVAPQPAPPAPAIAAEAPLRVGALGTSSAASSGNTLDTQTLDTHAMRARTAAPVAATANSHATAQEATPASADKAEMLGLTQQQAASKATTPAPVMPEVRKEARRAADAGFVDDPEQDVPPATVDSPVVRDAWLHRIVELLDQGKQREAKASLNEFRHRYPAAILPPRLHALQIEIEP